MEAFVREDAAVQEDGGGLDAEDDREIHGTGGDERLVQVVKIFYMLDNHHEFMLAHPKTCELGQQADANSSEDLLQILAEANPRI